VITSGDGGFLLTFSRCRWLAILYQARAIFGAGLEDDMGVERNGADQDIFRVIF